jgi:rhodanese-related sulfurtransferase
MKWYKISILSIFLLSIISCNGPVSTKVYNNVDELSADLIKSTNTISQKDFKDLLACDAKYNLLDCREKEMYNTSCIPGAVNIARGKLEFEIGNKIQERSLPLYIYSDSQAKSVLVANSLKYIKFSSVIVIEGDWTTWETDYPDAIQLEPNAGQVQEEAAPAVEEGGCGG